MSSFLPGIFIFSGLEFWKCVLSSWAFSRMSKEPHLGHLRVKVSEASWSSSEGLSIRLGAVWPLRHSFLLLIGLLNSDRSWTTFWGQCDGSNVCCFWMWLPKEGPLGQLDALRCLSFSLPQAKTAGDARALGDQPWRPLANRMCAVTAVGPLRGHHSSRALLLRQFC